MRRFSQKITKATKRGKIRIAENLICLRALCELLLNGQAATECSSGLAVLRKQGNWFLSMKWSDRIAQGFNPGLGRKKRALKVAPDVWARPADRRPNNPNTRLGRHFSSSTPVSPKATADRQGASCDVIPRAEAGLFCQTISLSKTVIMPSIRALAAGSLIEQYFHGTQQFSSID